MRDLWVMCGPRQLVKRVAVGLSGLREALRQLGPEKQFGLGAQFPLLSLFSFSFPILFVYFSDFNLKFKFDSEFQTYQMHQSKVSAWVAIVLYTFYANYVIHLCRCFQIYSS